MSTGELYEWHLIQMPTLGRKFKIGDVYDYNNDTILADACLSWRSAKLASATQFETRMENQFLIHFGSENLTFQHKAASIGLDNDMQMSFLVGSTCNSQSASAGYLNDVTEEGQAICTIICRAKTKQENLNLQMLVSQERPHIQNFDIQLSNFVHVISSISYGAEIYCVLVRPFEEDELDEDAHKEMEEKLCKLATKWRDALSTFQNLTNFKKQFKRQEKHFIASVNCRLYADLQTEPVLSCGFFDAYKRSLDVMKTIFTMPEEAGSSKAVPIAIKLCPMIVLMDPHWQIDKRVFYYEVDKRATAICNTKLAILNQAINRAEKMLETEGKSVATEGLEQFIRLVVNHKKLLQAQINAKVWKCRVNRLANSYEYVEKVVSKNHPPFSPSILSHWLDLKLGSLKVIKSIAVKTESQIRFIPHHLEEHLIGSQKKFAAVLFIPPLDDWTNGILSAMEHGIQSDNQFIRMEDGRVNYTTSHWFMEMEKKKIVLDKFNELESHVERNRELSNQIEFIVSEQAKENVKFRCSYSVYEANQLLKENIYRLPDKPSGLQVFRLSVNGKSKIIESFRVEWDYGDVGYPYAFLVESRLKGSSNWIQHNLIEPDTTQLVVSFVAGSTMQFRVAAETCIGRSEYSQVVDTDSAIEDEDEPFQAIHQEKENTLLDPTELDVTSVTDNMAKLGSDYSDSFDLVKLAVLDSDIGNFPSVSLPEPQSITVDYFLFVNDIDSLDDKKKSDNNVKTPKRKTKTRRECKDTEEYEKYRESNNLSARKNRLQAKKNMQALEQQTKVLKEAIFSINDLVSDSTDIPATFRLELANAVLIAFEEHFMPVPSPLKDDLGEAPSSSNADPSNSEDTDRSKKSVRQRNNVACAPSSSNADPSNSEDTDRSKKSFRERNNVACRKNRLKMKTKKLELVKLVGELKNAIHVLRCLVSDIDENYPDDIKLQVEKAVQLL